VNVLFIDGPVKGELHNIEDLNNIVIPVPPKITVNDEIYLINVKYYIHTFQLCGYHICLGSTQVMTGNIDPYDVYSHVVSEKARMATKW